MGAIVKITGTGSYLPPYIMSSNELAKATKIKNGEWIEKHLGIRERRFYSLIDPITGRAKNETDELQMAAAAGKKAIQNANINPKNISGLWYVSCTQDPRKNIHFNRMAIMLRDALKINEDAFALEIDSGCGGLIQAIGVSNDMIKGDDKPNILIIASNATSLYIDRDLYLKAGAWLSIFIFGDGAGAMLLQKKNSSEESGILATYYASSNIHPLMYFHNKSNVSGITYLDKNVYEIDAKAVKEHYPIFMNRAIYGLQKKHKFHLQDIDRFYFHQANKNILCEFAKNLEISLDKVAINVDRYGNLSAASIAVLFDEDLKEGKIKEGDLCLFCAVGAGTHFGSFLYRV